MNYDGDGNRVRFGVGLPGGGGPVVGKMAGMSWGAKKKKKVGVTHMCTPRFFTKKKSASSTLN